MCTCVYVVAVDVFMLTRYGCVCGLGVLQARLMCARLWFGCPSGLTFEDDPDVLTMQPIDDLGFDFGTPAEADKPVSPAPEPEPIRFQDLGITASGAPVTDTQVRRIRWN